MWRALGLAGVVGALLAGPALAEDGDIGLHGFGDLSFKNDYITPRGLRVTSEGSTVQLLGGLVLDFPQNPSATITDVSVVVGSWVDFNPGYKKPNTQVLNEYDWFVGVDAKFGSKWKAGVQYVEFISAPGAFKTEKNLEFSLSYADGLEPVTINPYVKLFYAMDGDSTVVTGKRGDTYDVEIGASPSIKLDPVILSAPTWVTVGPKGYWGGDQNAGVFSTGLKATLPLDLPNSAGHWSVYAGYQYYHLINDNLVLAQSLLNQGKHDRNLHLFQVGVGVGF